MDTQNHIVTEKLNKLIKRAEERLRPKLLDVVIYAMSALLIMTLINRHLIKLLGIRIP